MRNEIKITFKEGKKIKSFTLDTLLNFLLPEIGIVEIIKISWFDKLFKTKKYEAYLESLDIVYVSSERNVLRNLVSMYVKDILSENGGKKK